MKVELKRLRERVEGIRTQRDLPDVFDAHTNTERGVDGVLHLKRVEGFLFRDQFGEVWHVAGSMEGGVVLLPQLEDTEAHNGERNDTC